MKNFTKLLAMALVLLLGTSLYAQEKETVIVEKSPAMGRAVGDDVTNPIMIEQGDLPFTESNSTCGHLNVYQDTDMGSYDGGEDIFYQLNLDNEMMVMISVSPADSWTGVGLFQGTDPNNATFISTVSNSGSSDRVIVETLSAGSYFIMLDSWPNPTCYDFDITVEEFTYDPGQDPSTAIEVLQGDLPFSEDNSTCGMMDLYEDTDMGSYDGGEDMFYKLMLDDPMGVKITMTPEEYWSGMGIFQGEDPNEADFIEYITAGFSMDDQIITAVLDAGTYYLMLDIYPSPECYDFSLNIETFAAAFTPEDFTASVDPASAPGAPIINLDWSAGDNTEDLENYLVIRDYNGETDTIAEPTETNYTDTDLVDDGMYTYRIVAVTADDESDPTPDVTIQALVEAEFAIEPESHTFGEVGLLDGEPYHEVDNAEFSVMNTGVGTFNITEEPYFFSGQTESFNYVGDASFPFPIEGPFSSTGESFDFEVEFVPETAGLLSTLLVVVDDMGRVTRTFEINGSAYDIPDYDIVENAYMIDQDWAFENDFTTAMNFDNFYDDYRLEAGADADVVYHFSVDKDSYVNFNDVTSVDGFGVFADGVAIEEDNNLYEGGQLAIGAGSYYVVASGSGEYEFTLHIEGQEPIMVVEPESMDLGDVPIGCWHEGGTFEVYNDGGQTITFTGASLSDENGVFELDHRYEFPLTISTETLEFDIFMDADTPGDYEGAFLLTDEETTYIYPISGTAYTPIVGDVICDPIVAGFDGTGHYEDDNSVANPPMRDNYHLEEGYGDVVYKFSYPNDMIIDIALDNSVMDPHMVVFSEEDVLNLTPDQITPIAEGGQELMDLELWGGTYYVIVAGDDATDADYTLTMDVEDMPAPGDITLLTPEDGAEDIPADATLTWELGDYTNNIDVYVDTQYPPTDKVLNSGEPVETIDVEALAPAQIYFWKVVAHNDGGSTESETWAFTTQLPPPLFVQGEIFDYVNVHLWWNNPYDATFRISEDFENEEIPEGWTMTTNAEGSSAGWFVTDNGSSSYFNIPPHTFYAVTNDDANNDDASEDYLIMPAHDFSAWDMASLTFESYFTGDYSQSAYVEISTDGGDTFELVHELEPNPDAWTEITVDLTDYAVEGNTEVHVAFHGDDNGAWASGWAVDDVLLEFENELGGVNRALQGYNIYQNGEQINEELVLEEEYDVMDLAAGDYVFGVSAVYDEGESEITEIEAITILGMSEIAGTVTDYVTGDPIEGANITITGMWYEEELEYTLTTDADGNYSQVLPVTLDGFEVTAAASGYEAMTEEDVMPEAAMTEVVDFALGEFPIPVADVLAVSNDDESIATITWSAPSGFPSYEIVYDDGIATNATAWNAGFEGNMNALKFTPSGYPATIKETQIHIWDGTWPAGDVFNPMEVVILDDDGPDGLPGTELGSVEVTPESANWVTVDLSSLNVTINEGEFYIANRQISVYPDCPPTGIAEGTPQNRSYSFTGGEWGTASYDCFMIRATVAGPQGTEQLGLEEQGERVDVKKVMNQGAVGINPSDKALGKYYQGLGETRTVAQAPANTRAVDHYQVWRFMADDVDDPAEWEMLADDITATEYQDLEFADLDMGVYQYAVVAVYPITTAEPRLSNELPKDMWSNVLVMVELNTGEPADSVEITLEQNMEEPEYVYEGLTDANGQIQFPEFWKGEYILTAELEGFDPVVQTHEILESFYIIEVMMIETLAIPENLESTVDCDEVYLTWEQGSGAGGGGEYSHDFSGDFPPEGWTASAPEPHQESSNEAGGEAPEVEFYWLNLEDGHYLESDEGTIPESDILEFKTYIDNYSGGDPYNCIVKVNGEDVTPWSNPVNNDVGPETYQIDISDFDDPVVTFEFTGDYFGINSWFIDDLMVYPEGARGGQMAESRELEGYNVYRNDELLTSEPIMETEYTDEGVPGGMHQYFVSAVYTTGQSDPSEIAEVEVEMINPAEDLTAERQAWDNVFLEWAPPSDQAIYTLQYDNGENYTAIGTDEAFDFAVASRWYPDQLDTYDGMYLTEISFFPAEEASEYYIRVWTGSDATLVADQLVVEPNIGEWNTVELDTPVQIDASEEFWFGYRANAEAGFPAGCDAGPAVAGKGDMLMDPEAGWVVMSEAYGLDYNWNLAGTVTGGDGEQAQLTQLDETITPVDNRAQIAQGEINTDPVALNLENRALDGYNLYKSMNGGDEVMIAENWGQTFYIDYDVSMGFPDPFPEDGVTLTYWVVAQYESGCNPGPSNTAEAFYGVSNENNISDEISIYPNPAKEQVTIELTDNIDNVRVVNYVGQEVYSKRITSEDVLQIDHLNSGSYVVRLTTNSGETLIKRFVVVK